MMDTESCMLASWQYEWRCHGLELDLDTFWVDHGGDVTDERYTRLAAAVGLSYDRLASHRRRVAYRDDLHSRLALLPGIDNWLAQAAAAGLLIAVASSSPGQWVRGLLAKTGCDTAISVFACGDEVRRPKPASDVYLLALERLGVAAREAVAVEDAPHGVAAAQAAGIRCIAIPNGHADPSQFACGPGALLSGRRCSGGRAGPAGSAVSLTVPAQPGPARPGAW